MICNIDQRMLNQKFYFALFYVRVDKAIRLYQSDSGITDLSNADFILDGRLMVAEWCRMIWFIRPSIIVIMCFDEGQLSPRQGIRLLMGAVYQ